MILCAGRAICRLYTPINQVTLGSKWDVPVAYPDHAMLAGAVNKKYS